MLMKHLPFMQVSPPPSIGQFIVVHLTVKPLIWDEAEGDLVVIENSI